MFERIQALGSMRGFVDHMPVGDQGSFTRTWYSDLICDHMDMLDRQCRFGDGEIEALAVFMPPRHGKTTLAELMIARTLALAPATDVLGFVYSVEGSTKMMSNVCDYMRTPEYKRITRTRIEKGLDGRKGRTQSNFTEILGSFRPGRFITTSLQGRVTGEGSHLTIFDDLVQNSGKARSRAEQERNKEEIEKTAFTRRHARHAQLLIATLWDLDDASHYIIRRWQEQGLRYKVLVLRAEREEDAFDYDPRAPGELLDTTRFTPQHYDVFRSGKAWRALYQQDPRHSQGRMFPRGVWEYYDPAWLGDRSRNRGQGIVESVICSIDANAVKDGGSYAQIDTYAVVCVPGETPHMPTKRELWKMREARGKWGYPGLRANALAEFERWGSTLSHILIENKAAGQSLIAELNAQNPTMAEVVGINPRGSKFDRADAALPEILAHRVRVPQYSEGLVTADWVDVHKSEFFHFGESGHNDDRVDALTQAVLWARLNLGLTP